jgi:glyoxylase-like metal-dependent hydrolase (beta-lactamase superfamily II)
MKISKIGSRINNNWLIETPDGVIAIDTGPSDDASRFWNNLKQRGAIDDLRYVFLTHAHGDHAGFIDEVLAKTNAAVIVSDETQKILADGKPPIKYEYKNLLGKIITKIMPSLINAYPMMRETNRLQTVSDGDLLYGSLGIKAEVIYLSGHTSDSIGLFLPDENILFCGDAAMNVPLFNANRHIILIESIRDYKSFWDKIIEKNPNLIYPAHGKPFPVSDLIKYREYLG